MQTPTAAPVRKRGLLRPILRPWLPVMALGLHLAVLAAPLVPGAPVPLITLEDQHGKPVRVDAGTRRLLFSAERGVNEMVSRVLLAQASGVLERQETVYLADISAMPAVITRLIALPRMRELPFAIGLAREPAQVAQVADLPRQPGAATVLRFVDGKLVDIHLARNEGQLRAALGLEP
ncbi:MAG TPA: hypothetical protein PLA97_16700 [Rubrivivax sp.]|nr:hypothetical protein [Rubrivivax sp.]